MEKQQVDARSGTVVKTIGNYEAAKGELDGPVDVRLDEQHNIVLIEGGKDRIQIVTAANTRG